MSSDLLPAAYHDLTPIHELAFPLPVGAAVFGDKGYISAPEAQTMLDDTGVRLVSIHRQNMEPNSWADDFDLRRFIPNSKRWAFEAYTLAPILVLN